MKRRPSHEEDTRKHEGLRSLPNSARHSHYRAVHRAFSLGHARRRRVLRETQALARKRADKACISSAANARPNPRASSRRAEQARWERGVPSAHRSSKRPHARSIAFAEYHADRTHKRACTKEALGWMNRRGLLVFREYTPGACRAWQLSGRSRQRSGYSPITKRTKPSTLMVPPSSLATPLTYSEMDWSGFFTNSCSVRTFSL